MVTLPAVLLACAANVAPVTLNKVVQVESGFDPYALRVNGLRGPQPRAASRAQAAALARRYVTAGYRVDLGLMQIDSENLRALGLTIGEALEPCANIKGGGQILTDDYAAAARTRGDGQAALLAALSAYNTGSFVRGFENGYVARYFRHGAIPAVALSVAQLRARITPTPQAAPASRARPENPYTASTSIDFNAKEGGLSVRFNQQRRAF